VQITSTLVYMMVVGTCIYNLDSHNLNGNSTGKFKFSTKKTTILTVLRTLFLRNVWILIQTIVTRMTRRELEI
jgi:hypothetical protein